MEDWNQYYLVGDAGKIAQFVQNLLLETKDGMALPSSIMSVGPLYPQKTNGFDDEGSQKFERDTSSGDVMQLLSIQSKLFTVISELGKLTGVVVHQNTPVEEIRMYYPKYAAGQAIPYICN